MVHWLSESLGLSCLGHWTCSDSRDGEMGREPNWRERQKLVGRWGPSTVGRDPEAQAFS